MFKALSVRQADLLAFKFANFLHELLTQAEKITSNKTFEHWRQRDPKCRKFARALKTKGQKTTARKLTTTGDPCTVDRPGAAVQCTQITLIFFNYRYRLNRDESRRSPTCRKMTGISRDATTEYHSDPHWAMTKTKDCFQTHTRRQVFSAGKQCEWSELLAWSKPLRATTPVQNRARLSWDRLDSPLDAQLLRVFSCTADSIARNSRQNPYILIWLGPDRRTAGGRDSVKQHQTLSHTS